MASETQEPESEGNEGRREGWPRWSIWMLIALVLASVIVPSLLNRESGTAIDYSGLVDEVTDGRIDSIVVTNQTGAIRAEAFYG